MRGGRGGNVLFQSPMCLIVSSHRTQETSEGHVRFCTPDVSHTPRRAAPCTPRTSCTPRCTIGCDTCDGTTNHVGHGNQRFLYKGMTQAELNQKNLTVDNPWNPKPGDMVLDPTTTQGLAAKSNCANPTTNATICASSLRTCNSQAECGSKDVRFTASHNPQHTCPSPPRTLLPCPGLHSYNASMSVMRGGRGGNGRTSEAGSQNALLRSLFSAPSLPRPPHYTGLLLLLPLACTGIGARHRRLRGRGGAPPGPRHRARRRPVPEHDAGQAR